MTVLKKFFIGILIVAGLVIIALAIGSLAGSKCSWYLGLVNSGTEPADITVSLADGSWTVEPGEAKTIKIDGQKVEDAKTERTFTIKSGGRTEVLKTLVDYGIDRPGLTLLDVTGESCIFEADYGPQYREKDVKLPEGEPDIKILQIHQGKRLLSFPNVFATMLGEKLPEKIDSAYGVDIPTHVRLINVPCDTMADPETLYDYLDTH